MTPYKDLSREELLKEKENLEQQFAEIKAKGLKLDMSRGKPSTAQLNLSMGMMDVLDSNADLVCEEGVDCRQKIRVPRGKGKIEITCPSCRSKFIKRT